MYSFVARNDEETYFPLCEELGITQNIVDLLQNYTATTMLANLEFVALLKQANTDRKAVDNVAEA